MILTQENVHELTTEQLQEIVWDMYKAIHGVRPRWMSQRDDYLNFLHQELAPAMLEQRRQEWEAEEAYYEQLELQAMEVRDEPAGYIGEEYEQYEIF
jgi:hypothetical protein